MLHKILMPSLGATMEEGTILAWKVKESDTVNKGDILLELESDKSTYDFESPCAGIVRKIIVQADQTVPIQQLIAIIGDADEQIPADWLRACDKTAAAKQAEPTTSPAASTPEAANIPAPTKNRGVKISPRARKLAEKFGLDITTITGSGPGGRIESSDIERCHNESSES